jgi:hypothetical protein
MEDIDRAKFRVDALNLAYGILLNKFQAGLGMPKGSLLSAPIPTTETVLFEAQKLIKFIEG